MPDEIDLEKSLFPRGRYKASGLRNVEQHAIRILELLPNAKVERTRDVIQIEHDDRDMDGVVVVVTSEAVEFRLPTVEWTGGAYGPANTSRLWKRVTWVKLEAEPGLLPTIIADAKNARRAEFVACKYCNRMVPTENRINGNVCHGCASEHEHVVF